MKIFNTIIASSAAVIAGGLIAGGAAYFGGEEKKKVARRAGDARKQGYLDAIDTIAAAKDAAISEQQPYADQGKRMVDWFKKYNEDPNFKYDMYTQYAKVGDPLYDYYQNKQEKALNRQMAARGRFGGGRAIQAHGEQNSALSAKMAELTDTRVSREIQTNLSLLGSGQSAANNITNLQTQAGRDIAGYEVAMGQSQGQAETEIAQAGVDQISGIAGAATGVLGGLSQLGNVGTAAKGQAVIPGGGGQPQGPQFMGQQMYGAPIGPQPVQGANLAMYGQPIGPQPAGPVPGSRGTVKRLRSFGVNQTPMPGNQTYTPTGNVFQTGVNPVTGQPAKNPFQGNQIGSNWM